MEYIKKNTGILLLNTKFPITLGFLAKTCNDISYNGTVEENKGKEITLLSNILNINKENIKMLNQVHGDSILVVKNPSNKNIKYPEGDGMMTSRKKICLVIRTADCVPVFAFDIKKKILGAAHSGWRGCRLNISAKLVKEMKSVFKSDYSDIHVFILPSIGASYTVNEDVAAFFKKDIIIKDNKINLNLSKNIKRSLIEEGISGNNIYRSRLCTYSNNKLFSHRQGDKGRNLNFAYINGNSS